MLYPRDTYFGFRMMFLVQRNTQNSRYFMLTCENEQFHLLGPFSLTTLVKRVSEICRQNECISVMENTFYYSLLCSSALSNEERKNIVRKFKSNQRKRERSTINTMSTTCNLSEQRKSSGTVWWIEQRKKSFLKLVLKNIKKLMCQKRNKCLKIEEKSIKRLFVFVDYANQLSPTLKSFVFASPRSDCPDFLFKILIEEGQRIISMLMSTRYRAYQDAF